MTSVHPASRATGRAADRVDPSTPVLPDQMAGRTGNAPEGRGLLGSLCSQLPEGRRLSATRLHALDSQLSDRDRQILQIVTDHSFLTGLQLSRLLFADHATPASAERTCRRVLARLVRLRVLEHLQRRIGGVRAGSASYVFRVGLVGDQLFRQRAGASGRARRKEPSLRHLDHALAVGDTRVALTVAAHGGAFDLLRVETEPACWRRFPTVAGVDELLKPDLAAVTASGDYEDHWFLEIDRGTESLPTVLRKCRPYETYQAAGIEQARHGVFPRVLWVVPDQTRANRLRSAFRALPGQRDEAALFRVCTLPELPDLIQRGAA